MSFLASAVVNQSPQVLANRLKSKSIGEKFGVFSIGRVTRELDSIPQMKNAPLELGNLATCMAYYDEGAFVDNLNYIIVSGDADGFINHQLENGLMAKLISGKTPVPIDVTINDFKGMCLIPNTFLTMESGIFSNLNGDIALNSLDNLTIRGAGKDLTLFPYGVQLQIAQTVSNCHFQGFGVFFETNALDIGNTPKLISLSKSAGVFTWKDLKYEINCTNENAGGGGIGFQFLDSCDTVVCDDIYVKNTSTSGIWSGRKSGDASGGNRCKKAIVKNCTFENTIKHGFPVGHNISEVEEVNALNNQYIGWFLTPDRIVASTDPVGDDIPRGYYSEVIIDGNGDGWIAAIGTFESNWGWTPNSASSNKCYAQYQGDSTDGSTGLDAPKVFYSSNETFYNCDYMINVHHADFIVIENAVDIDNTCNNGINQPGIKAAATSRAQTRLLKISGGVMPNVFFSKADTVDLLSPPTIIGNDRGQFNGIHGYALNRPDTEGGSVIIGPVVIKNCARGAIQIDGFQNIQIQDGYYIENCGSAGNKTLNRDDGVSILNTNVNVDYYSIGKGTIISTDGNMPVGINTWSVRASKGTVSKEIHISDWANKSAGNSTGIYGAQVTKSPENGQYVGPPFGSYRMGEIVPSQDARFAGWVAVNNLDYGRYDYWLNDTNYSIGDRVCYGGYDWESKTDHSGTSPLISNQVDWESRQIVLQRFGGSVGY